MSASVIPSEDNVKSLLIIGGVAAAVYVVWKLYGASASIGNTVSQTISDAGDKVRSLYHSADAAVTSAGARGRAILSGGAVPGTGPDQSDAESARLGRADTSINASLPTIDEPSYDAMGNYQGNVQVPAPLGTVSSVYDSSPQLDGPDAAGLSTRPIDFGINSQGASW